MLNRNLGPRTIAFHAWWALLMELDTWPKPGLVSLVDQGSHTDMSADLLQRSAAALRPFFCDLADAGRQHAGFPVLQQIGKAAETKMLEATAGVNTHRGALFGLGLLCAAAGAGAPRLGDYVSQAWGRDILAATHAGMAHGSASSGCAGAGCVAHGCTAVGHAGADYSGTGGDAAESRVSHGFKVMRRFGFGGARAEAAHGFPNVFAVGLPALDAGARFAAGDANAARVHACFALIASVEDTNLVHRGGLSGLAFARATAARFMAGGGVGGSDWRQTSVAAHASFIERRLSPGGSADLLAMSLLAQAVDRSRQHPRYPQPQPAEMSSA